jgi:hypothetical protein
LPAAQFQQAFRILAVALVAPSGPIHAATATAETSSQAETPAAGARDCTESMLEMSQGRALLPTGPPERCTRSLGHFC